jgi:ligand-binding sensor domain-containing protein
MQSSHSLKSILSLSLILLLFSCQRDVSKSKNSEVRSDTIVSAKSVDAASGIVYFSFDNALSWQNKSEGLPQGITLTDLAVSNDYVFASTKQHGIFIYDFQTNLWTNTLTQPETNNDLNAIGFHEGELMVGTGGDGIFVSKDNGKTWSSNSRGLGNLTIRRITSIGNAIFIGTNGGLYSRNENKWQLEFGHNTLQVNGITTLDGDFYIGTNEGVYKLSAQDKKWKQVLSKMSLHNISSDSKNVYALTYSELFYSGDKGKTWVSDQNGLPKNLYSFQLKEKGKNIFVAQWDGVYKRERANKWISTSKGLPKKFPVTDLVIFNDILIASSSGWITDKP